MDAKMFTVTVDLQLKPNKYIRLHYGLGKKSVASQLTAAIRWS